MATIIWKETPPVWTAFVEDTPVCTLRSKDIGGWTASWAGERSGRRPLTCPGLRRRRRATS